MLWGGLDEHAPNKLRVNGPLMNFEQFAKAYGTLIKQLKASDTSSFEQFAKACGTFIKLLVYGALSY
jgi:hypothetical protein